MLENSFAILFFLKKTKRETPHRFIYLRVTVDGIAKEISIKKKWNVSRWDQKRGRARDNKEDAKVLNFYLDSLESKIMMFRAKMVTENKIIYAIDIINHIKGTDRKKNYVLIEFQKHNDEIEALIPSEYAAGTLERYKTAKSHLEEFINHTYKREDITFHELNYEFISEYAIYLKTVRKCSHNTTLKYISNFKKIVLRAVAKGIINSDPFIQFKSRKVKLNKRPLSWEELKRIETKEITNERLAVVRDVFVFQCYTGLAYIDVFSLKRSDIKKDANGELWIISNRQKTNSVSDVPLLPKAIQILDKYRHHPFCKTSNLALPVKSNQKMNGYLKEISAICGIDNELTTHKARRTFGSTVTLNMGVPIHVVKEMLGHHSVKQTEEYAITESKTISREMKLLQKRLAKEKRGNTKEFKYLSDDILNSNKNDALGKLRKLEQEIQRIKEEITD